MRKNKSIYWKEPNRNREAKGLPVAAVGMEVFYSLVCVLLFWVSVRLMLANVFNWASFDANQILPVGFLSVTISLLMEVSYYMKGKAGSLIRFGIPVFGVIVGVGYWILNNSGEMILSGSRQMLRYYVNLWNTYYSVSIQVPSGNSDYVSLALNFWLVVLFCFLLWEAKVLRRNMILVLIPAVVFVAELMIGYSPKAPGIFLMFAGILLANGTGWKETGLRPMAGKRKANVWSCSWLSTGVLGGFILLLCVVVHQAGNSSAEKVIANAGNFIDFQKNLETELQAFTWSNPFGLIDDSAVEEVTNNAPTYRNKPVLSVKTSDQPLGTIYLKGSYADTYTKGKWTRDIEAFEQACLDEGFDSNKISEELAALGMTKLENLSEDLMRDSSDVEEVYSHFSIYTQEMTLTYLKNSGTKAYCPYFIDLDHKDISIEGEARYTKKRTLTEYSFEIWGHEDQYMDYMEDFMIEGRLGWEDWYEEYVLEHYLEVPEGMENVEAFAEEIVLTKAIQGDAFRTENKENDRRLQLAEWVRSWLGMKTNYSLELSKLPEGEDPVEYFLGKSGQGYCMHYASAGVLILRALGVPARYASGYIVGAATFEETENGYEAQIMDNKAHAWAEIYLNGIGWIPIEMTKGYNNGSSNTTSMENQDASVTQNNNISDNQNREESEKSETIESETEEPETEESETQENQQNQDTEYRKKTGNSSGTAKVILCVMGIGAVAVGILAFLQRRKKDRIRLIKAMKRKRTSWAIKNINRKIYKKICFTGKIFSSHIRDQEYEAILKKNYPKVPEEDWSRYMKIVKAAAFSKEELSVEEMEFCYKIYQKVIQNS